MAELDRWKQAHAAQRRATLGRQSAAHTVAGGAGASTAGETESPTCALRPPSCASGTTADAALWGDGARPRARSWL
eukprot:scaffold141685_cov139-Phaeocystis_antarctica.AAC.4